jgi:hypothetical protein
LWKQCLYRFHVGTGHGENVRGLIDQPSSQRLAAQIANICPFLRADFYGIHARGLAANRVNPSRRDFDVLPIAGQAAKKPFRDRAPTNIACADEEDVFHGRERAANAFIKLKANLSKSISHGPGARFIMICGFSEWRIAVIVTTVPSLSSK